MDILQEYYSNNYLPEDLLWGKEYRFLKKEIRLMESQLVSFNLDTLKSFNELFPCIGFRYSKRVMCANGELDVPYSTFEDFIDRWNKFKKIKAFL